MSSDMDIEQRVRTRLADAPTPADLRLDAEAMTQVASRSHRRRRTGQTLLGGMASIVVLGTVIWAGGWLPGEVQRVLPASPWSRCALTWNETGSDIHLEAVEHAVIPLSEGGTVVAGVTRGCPDFDRLFFAATTAAPEVLPGSVPLQGGLEDRPDSHDALSWFNGLRLEDGREVTAVMVPRGSRGTVVVGPDAVHEPSTPPVRVPDAEYDAFVIEGYWPAGEDLASVWRDADGLVHTSWSAGITSRAWQGSDPAAELTDTWVGEDRREQQWVMREGEVQGPFPVSTGPWAVAFPTDDVDRVELVVVLPEMSGELALDDGSAVETLWLDSREGARTLHAALARLDRGQSGGAVLEWVPAGEGATAQAVDVLQP